MVYYYEIKEISVRIESFQTTECSTPPFLPHLSYPTSHRYKLKSILLNEDNFQN